MGSESELSEPRKSFDSSSEANLISTYENSSEEEKQDTLTKRKNRETASSSDADSEHIPSKRQRVSEVAEQCIFPQFSNYKFESQNSNSKRDKKFKSKAMDCKPYLTPELRATQPIFGDLATKPYASPSYPSSEGAAQSS